MSPLGHETILVVDDEIIVLSLASTMLRRYGYEPLTAASPAEALNLFAKWPDLRIDLLLIDIILPGMNGLALAEQIRQLRPNLPVLYMSGYSERDLLKPILTPALSYLPKPFTSLQLTRRIRQTLDREQVQSMSAGSDT
jgi:two-component system cell cycle sensor histidine kinase/response regulator CckA